MLKPLPQLVKKSERGEYNRGVGQYFQTPSFTVHVQHSPGLLNYRHKITINLKTKNSEVSCRKAININHANNYFGSARIISSSPLSAIKCGAGNVHGKKPTMRQYTRLL